MADSGDVLVPELVPPKDFADLVIHIESFVKSDTGAKEGSAIEAVQRFLNGDSDERTKQPAGKYASKVIQ